MTRPLPYAQRATVLVDDDTRRRVGALVSAVGESRALAMLGCGSATLDAARDRGRMRKDTLDRLRGKLAECEAEIARKVSA
jgi:hypothetical protein